MSTMISVVLSPQIVLKLDAVLAHMNSGEFGAVHSRSSYIRALVLKSLDAVVLPETPTSVSTPVVETPAVKVEPLKWKVVLIPGHLSKLWTCECSNGKTCGREHNKLTMARQHCRELNSPKVAK